MILVSCLFLFCLWGGVFYCKRGFPSYRQFGFASFFVCIFLERIGTSCSESFVCTTYSFFYIKSFLIKKKKNSDTQHLSHQPTCSPHLFQPKPKVALQLVPLQQSNFLLYLPRCFVFCLGILFFPSMDLCKLKS